MQLVRYEAARHALQEARSVDEVKDVKDKAEALRLYARQANDRDMEVWTSEIKVRAVRRIGELSSSLDTAKNQYALPAARKSKSDALAEAGISTSSAHEYEKVAAIDEALFEARIIEARNTRDAVTIESLLKPHVSNNAGNNEWYTPASFIAAALAVMGSIDVDPASSAIANETVHADTFYTAQQDGLKQSWRGNVWMNPPYAQPLIAEFCEAVTAKFESNEIQQACVLVNNATETAWFQRMLEAASAVCLVKTRVRFLDPDGKPGAPLQGQAVVYFGIRVDVFAVNFEPFGKVLRA